MSAVATRTAARVTFPNLCDGCGNPVAIPAADLVVMTKRALRCLGKARAYLNEARLRGFSDQTVQEPLDIALMALAEAVAASRARVLALESGSVTEQRWIDRGAMR